MDSSLVTLSKFLSYLLRHGAEKEDLSLSTDGYASVDDILALPQARRNRYSLEQIQRVVNDNDKKRFALKKEGDRYFIRANQGHSDARVVDLALVPITSVDQLAEGIAVHGTYFEAWKTIKTEGLCRMTRNHIHFALGEFGAGSVVSGMRSSAQIMIYLDVPKALSAKIPLFLSANGVVLSPGLGPRGIISTEYFLAVVRVSDKKPFDPAFPAPPPKKTQPSLAPGAEEKEMKESVAVPSAAAPESGATPANRKRNLERRLVQIADLKAKLAGGAALNKDQIAKISKEAEIRAEIAAIGDC